MRSYLKKSAAILIVLMTIAGCGGSSKTSSDSNETQSSNSTASKDNSSASDTTPPEESDTTPPEEDDAEVSDETIGQIGYGHSMDDFYIKDVLKNMNGSQKDEYSEAQLFNFARNTCTDLKAGNYAKTIKLLKSLKGSNDFSLFSSMTVSAVYAYCLAYKEPFVTKATAAGL